MHTTTTRCITRMDASTSLHTLPYFLRIMKLECLQAFLHLMWDDNNNISKILHAMVIHEEATSKFHTRPSPWRRLIEVAFHPNILHQQG